MVKKQIEIRSEYSAQRKSHPTNVALRTALEYLSSKYGCWEEIRRVADLGCGKLRHYRLLSDFPEIFLVDTERQLSNRHCDGDDEYTVREFAEEQCSSDHLVCAKTVEQFAKSRLHLDLIICVAVLDAVLPSVRKSIIESASRNLKARGLFVLIVPRNDSTILRRCNAENSYADGHAFANRGAHTFFCNFKKHDALINLCRRSELDVVQDLSIYRHVCLITTKLKRTNNARRPGKERSLPHAKR
jgi:hypothetical protein